MSKTIVRKRTGYNGTCGKSRKFCCITYLNEEQLKICLTAHLQQIRVWAYAYHDKDIKEDGTLKEPHFHLIIVTYCPNTVSAIRRWFSGFISNDLPITTTAQICSDVYEMYDYLIHDTVQCKAEGKFQYDKSIRKTCEYAIKSRYFQASAESDYDNITLATEMLLKGEKVRDLGKIFGRDFILHYNAIKNYVNDVMRFQKYNMSLEDILEREYDLEVWKLNND